MSDQDPQPRTRGEARDQQREGSDTGMKPLYVASSVLLGIGLIGGAASAMTIMDRQPDTISAGEPAPSPQSSAPAGDGPDRSSAEPSASPSVSASESAVASSSGTAAPQTVTPSASIGSSSVSASPSHTSTRPTVGGSGDDDATASTATPPASSGGVTPPPRHETGSSGVTESDSSSVSEGDGSSQVSAMAALQGTLTEASQTQAQWSEVVSAVVGYPRGRVVPLAAIDYEVVAGDTLYGIAREHGASAQELIELNGYTDPDLLLVGTTVRLPVEREVGEMMQYEQNLQTARDQTHQHRTPFVIGASDTELPMDHYVVGAGDTLGAIARATGVSVDEIMSANGLGSDLIYVDQELVIPQYPQVTGR